MKTVWKKKKKNPLIKMFWILLTLLLTTSTDGFRFAIIGPQSSTMAPAKHCSSFYRVPVLSPERLVCCPSDFVVLAETEQDLEYYLDMDIQILHWKNYPHKTRHDNYFLSWIKQNI